MSGKKVSLVGYKEYHQFLEFGADESASIIINCSSRLSIDDVYKLLYEAYGLREGEVEYLSVGILRRGTVCPF